MTAACALLALASAHADESAQDRAETAWALRQTIIDSAAESQPAYEPARPYGRVGPIEYSRQQWCHMALLRGQADDVCE